MIAAGSNQALDRLRPYILKTPLVESTVLGSKIGCRVRLKCEHRQITGSFKVRGALNKILNLPRQRLDEGVIVASTGNHGAAVAYACRLIGGKCTVVVPEDVSSTKAEAVEKLGAQIHRFGSDGSDAERFAREWAVSDNLEYISPYNDVDVIVGQSTLATEMLEEVDQDCTVYVAVGGGGLISGMSTVLKAAFPGIRIVGCSPENHPVMDASVKAGYIVDLPYRPTLSDGTAGGLEHDTITLPLCTAGVDSWVRVSEPEIRDALRLLAGQERMIVEGAAAVAVAAMQKHELPPTMSRVAILCGANIDRDRLKRILDDV
jgi:threonine dehydratase